LTRAHFNEYEAGLDGLSQADFIADKQAVTRRVEELDQWLKLVGKETSP
jgi:hypothetical protein